jgi:hypothetical protein
MVASRRPAAAHVARPRRVVDAQVEHRAQQGGTLARRRICAEQALHALAPLRLGGQTLQPEQRVEDGVQRPPGAGAVERRAAALSENEAGASRRLREGVAEM